MKGGVRMRVRVRKGVEDDKGVVMSRRAWSPFLCAILAILAIGAPVSAQRATTPGRALAIEDYYRIQTVAEMTGVATGTRTSRDPPL